MELGILVSGVSTVWEDTEGYSKQYRCSIAFYLMTLLWFLYGIIMYRAINASCHRNIFVDGLNATDKFVWSDKWNF